MSTLAPCELFDLDAFAVVCLVEYIRNRSLCRDRDLISIDHSDVVALNISCLSQLIDMGAFPAFRKLPGGRSALLVPVIELLVLVCQLISVEIPEPRDQVCLAVHDLPAVEVHISMSVICGSSVCRFSFYNDCVLFCLILKRDPLFRSPGRSAYCRRLAVLPLHHKIVLQEFGRKVIIEQILDVRLIVIASLPSLEVFHIIAAQKRFYCCSAVARIISDP